MPTNEPDTPDDAAQPPVGADYVLAQFAQALTTEALHPDPATRQRSRQRLADWGRVFTGLLAGPPACRSATAPAGPPTRGTPSGPPGGLRRGRVAGWGSNRPGGWGRAMA